MTTKTVQTFEIKRDDEWWVASTNSLDRGGDVVEPSGIDFKNWQRAGSPILYGHDYRAFWNPIGKATEIQVNENEFRIKPEWREPAGPNDPMIVVRSLLDTDLLRALSIGFRPLSAERMEDSGGFHFTEVELLEVSVVVVPANQDALRLAAKALGLDVEEDRHTQELLALIEKAEQVTKTLGDLLQTDTSGANPDQPEPHEPDSPEGNPEPDTVPQRDDTPSTADAEPDDDPQPTADHHTDELSAEEMAAVTARLAEFMDAVSTYIN